MENKENILDLYYNKHLKQKDIATIVGVSKQYVSKIIKADSRCKEEKQIRKDNNAIKRKDFMNNTITIKHKVIEAIVDDKRTLLLIENNKKSCGNSYMKKYKDYIFHDLRHSCASLLLAKNISANVLSEAISFW